MKLEIYTDGACKGNPGPGGWGYTFKTSLDLIQVKGGPVPDTTNNRMELEAVIHALADEDVQSHLESGGHICIHSDSQYVIKGITQWVDGWKRKNWKTAEKKPVKNQDLWQALDTATSAFPDQITWNWVKGHVDNAGNNLADKLATEAAAGNLEY